jgi:hypothetical protein
MTEEFTVLEHLIKEQSPKNAWRYCADFRVDQKDTAVHGFFLITPG